MAIRCFLIEPTKKTVDGATIWKRVSSPDAPLPKKLESEKILLRSAPVGAMWHAHWMGPKFRSDVDGLHLVVQTPGGMWAIDGLTPDGKRWERTGDAPLITVTPDVTLPASDGRPGFRGRLVVGELHVDEEACSSVR